MKCPLSLTWLVFLLAVVPSAIHAQSTTCATHPVDLTAQFLGSFWVDVDIGSPLQVENCQSHVEICTWLIASGQTDYVINANSLYFTGDCADVNTMPFSEIMSTVASAAVVKGVGLEYSDCGDTVEVWGASCADRMGADNSTTFVSCNEELCTRRYVITCPPEGGVVLEQLYEDSSICLTPGCEVGCDDGE